MLGHVLAALRIRGRGPRSDQDVAPKLPGSVANVSHREKELLKHERGALPGRLAIVVILSAGFLFLRYNYGLVEDEARPRESGGQGGL